MNSALQQCDITINYHQKVLYSSRAFIQVVIPLGFIGQFRIEVLVWSNSTLAVKGLKLII